MKRVITIQHCQSEQHVNNSCGIFGGVGAVGEFDVNRGWEHRILRVGDLSYIRD